LRWLRSSVLLACLDIALEKVAMLSRKESPTDDAAIQDFLKNKQLNFHATLDKQEAYVGADYVIIATPTDYDLETNYFNTQSIEAVIRDVMAINTAATTVNNSTVPAGYTECTEVPWSAKLHPNKKIFSRGKGALRQLVPVAYRYWRDI
jgi:UDP-glucose 6-dehydrogenase